MNDDGTDEIQITLSNKPNLYNYPDWSPKENIAVFSRKEVNDLNAIYLINLENKKEEFVLSEQNKFIKNPKWAPNGEKIAYILTDKVNHGTGDLILYDFANGSKYFIAKNINTDFSWADNDYILATIYNLDNVDIYAINMNTKKIDIIKKSIYNEKYPIYSPHKRFDIKINTDLTPEENIQIRKKLNELKHEGLI